MNTGILISKNKKYKVGINILFKYHQEQNTIGLIKEYHRFTNCGLKEAKDKIEECLDAVYNHTNYSSTKRWTQETFNSLIKEFRAVSFIENTLTKEEFLNIISDGIDGMDKLGFTDMLEAMECLLTNIKRNGGLKVIAEKRGEFLEAI